MKTLILGGHLIDPANGMDGQYNLLLERERSWIPPTAAPCGHKDKGAPTPQQQTNRSLRHENGIPTAGGRRWGGDYQVFFTNFSLQRGQVMEILPLPRGTRTVWRHLGQSK